MRAPWTSPEGQPAWARPVLWLIAAGAGVAYAWGIRGDDLEIYYAAAVRSMSMSWRNFFFGGFDPSGTITLDKLPGAFWVQALSVRLFGVHVWAIVGPQVVEGVLAVLVLYRVVRRLAGPGAGLIAALVLAASPATVMLNRGNVSDTLMTLLLVLAADAVVTALLEDRPRHLLLAALWVGLAFQAKMLQAWLVLPALAVPYLVAAPGSLARRARWLVAAGALVAVVSLSWMTVVSLTPARDRPWVDGSHHNSVFDQVFVYNGFGRLDQSPLALLNNASLGIELPSSPPAAWNRLLKGVDGRDAGWLLPAGLIAIGGGLIARRRQPREDPVRACVLLWGTWLVVLFAAFTLASSVNPYYTTVFSPALGGVLGVGLTLAWGSRPGRMAVAATVAVSAAYGAWLLPGSGTGLPGWLAPALIVVSIVAILAVVAGAASTAGPEWLVPAGLAASAAAVLLVPATASASIVNHQLGPFDTPFQPENVTDYNRLLFNAIPKEVIPTLPRLESDRRGAPDLVATQTSVLAAAYIFYSGQEALPIGGFTGSIPSPTLAQIERDVAEGKFHLVITGSGYDPRIAWIAAHCINVRSATGHLSLHVYFCLPSSAG
jgi:4-amino-4-deoxy-L-arabinose transferase-like glycosyltransferase